ncbi:hypothetical protein Poli38472_014789 [Pythium oligandrum]|uniref:Ubiquitin-like protease family profile domain-containing protein n=1 Tax=Pythium oligandrum TaxID=41045 RepID=A0A8K1CHV5_PYTOL|nr:hypothetical protein Poli38472_014789 [Pythium oligandrum]|eukprot:TMW63879.1 hypothetical protein Poli38472_014789 [Pythium oligandrum]
MSEYDGIRTPPDGTRHRRFGVDRRRFTAANGSRGAVVENARDDGRTAQFASVARHVASQHPRHRDAPEFNFEDRSSHERNGERRATGTGKYMAKPRGVGMAVRPGEAIMGKNEEEQRLIKNYNPPKTQDSFLATIEKSKRPPTTLATGLPRRVLRQSLESASAPPPTSPPPRLPQRVIVKPTTKPRDEWKSTRVPITERYGKLRVELTPPVKRARTSVKKDREDSPPPCAIAFTRTADSNPLRISSEIQHTGPSAARRYSLTQSAGENSPPIPRRKSRRLAKEAQAGDSADMPIQLDSDSDTDSAASEDQQPPAPAPVDDIDPEELDDDSFDLAQIEEDSIVSVKNCRAWWGKRACLLDLFVDNQYLRFCSIRGVKEKWELRRNVCIKHKKVEELRLYQWNQQEADNLDTSNPVEKIMATTSLIAFKFPIPYVRNKGEWRVFFDPSSNGRTGEDFGTARDCLQWSEEQASILDINHVKQYVQAILASDDHHIITNPPTPEKKESKTRKRRMNRDGADATRLTYPLPPCSVDIVTITAQDISRLQPEQYLNDNIIDYYFKRLLLEDYQSDPAIQRNVLFLSSHFYTRLSMGKGPTLADRLQAGYNNVSTWLTRNDFFNRSLIFVPINKSVHWSLAIIINPKLAGVDEDEHDNCDATSCIALLDPLGSYHNKATINRNLRSFLRLEWENSTKAAEENDEVTSSYDVDKVSMVFVKAPQQTNGYDCGVYVLKYAQEILINFQHLLNQAKKDTGPMLIRKAITETKLDTLIASDAFNARDIERKREELEELLAEDTKRYEAILHGDEASSGI